MLFHCRHPCPVKCEADLTGINGNGKIIYLCASSEAGGGNYPNHLHSEAGGLRYQINE